MLSKDIKKRVFVVGSPRSGTSLLQSLIGGHPSIQSFPETHIFYNLFSNKLYNLLHLTPPKSINDFNNFSNLITKKTISNYYQWDLFTQKIFIRKSIELLDEITLRNSKSSWSEKTPLHLHCIDQLGKINENFKFIHIIREGQDVVASSYTLNKNYPNSSWSYNRNLDYWISRWIQDIRISRRYISEPNHFFVFYSDLIKNAQETMNFLFDFLSLEKIDLQKKDYKKSAYNSGFTKEPWHINLNRNIGDKIPQKNILNEEELNQLRRSIPPNLYSDFENNFRNK